MTERAKVIPIRPLREILKRKLIEKRKEELKAEFWEHLEKKGIRPKPVKKIVSRKAVRVPVQLELFP